MSAPALLTASWIINMILFRLTDCENITWCSAASSRALSHYWFLQRERETTQWLAVPSIINQSVHAQIGLIKPLLVMKSLIATQTKGERRQFCNLSDLETRQWFMDCLWSWDVTVVSDYWREKTLTGNSEQIQSAKIIIFQTIGVHWFQNQNQTH